MAAAIAYPDIVVGLSAEERRDVASVRKKVGQALIRASVPRREVDKCAAAIERASDAGAALAAADAWVTLRQD